MQVAREDADESRRFEWDKQNLLLETDDLGTPLARNTHEPDEYGRLVSREDLTTSEPAYYHYDALGSTAALSDPSEVVGDDYQYKAWGKQTAPTADPQPYRWVGELGYRIQAVPNVSLTRGMKRCCSCSVGQQRVVTWRARESGDGRLALR